MLWKKPDAAGDHLFGQGSGGRPQPIEDLSDQVQQYPMIETDRAVLVDVPGIADLHGAASDGLSEPIMKRGPYRRRTDVQGQHQWAFGTIRDGSLRPRQSQLPAGLQPSIGSYRQSH